MYKSWMWKQRSYREQFQGDEANGGAGGTGGADQSHQGEQQPSGETPGEQQPAGEGETSTDDDEVVITIGEEAPPASNEDESQSNGLAPQWLKDLRKSDRENKRRLRELEEENTRLKGGSAPAAAAVGEKPTLEGCEFDAERFETELTAWHEQKRKADEQTAKARKEQEDAQAAWNARLTAYKTAKTSLKVPDFEDAEEVVLGTLNQTQQGIIVSGADNPAALIYALGKNPAKAKELASIKDPVKYAFAVAKLETQLKVTSRKAAPAPERVVRGSAAGATGVDNTLIRLEAEADRTGDRSKVIAYKREQRRKAA